MPLLVVQGVECRVLAFARGAGDLARRRRNIGECMARTSRTQAKSGSQRVKQLLVAAGALAALIFAVQGGEYGTRDLMRQRARRAGLLATIDSLQHMVDSLRRYKTRVETDPALQERIAREEFGLVRGNKELVYRIAEPDSTPRARQD